MYYTTDELVAAIKRRSLMPSSQVTYSTEDLVAFLNEELQLSLAADLLSAREDFFLRTTEVSLIATVGSYGIPERASGNSLKKVFLIDSQGNRKALRRYHIEAIGDQSQTGDPDGFIVAGDELIIIPAPSASSGALELWYFERPNELVLTELVGEITAMNASGSDTIFTVDTDLTTSVAANGRVDFLSTKSPFLLWASDVVASAVTTTTITVPTADVSDEAGNIQPQIGDYLCPAQTANIPQIPSEFHPILTQMVACRILEGLGDLQKLQAATSKLTEMRRQAFQLIANRVESELEPVVNSNSLLNATSGDGGSGSGVSWF